ncbi:MAG: phage portal protein [Planctomycetaceae bacterium]|nr:phage portal protein [Planctomycetaceae bacterium]
MLQFVRDTITTWQLRARYQRRIHEQLLQFTEQQTNQPVAADPGQWQLAGGSLPLTAPQRTDIRQRARRLSRTNPHARNILRLLQAYVTGPGLTLNHRLIDDTCEPRPDLLRQATSLWHRFCEANMRHYSFTEHARRTWRDGECFLRKYSTDQWPPTVRFIDPELIASSPEHPESDGILSAPLDVESPTEYLKVDPATARLAEAIPADEVQHTRIGCDSNEKRGVTIFAPMLDALDCFEQWVDTELQARKLQSSIVLWRKVQGSPQQAANFADGAGQASTGDPRRERLQPGTILTTNHGTDIQFLQPNTNFGDAVPLGRMLLLRVAAGAGLPEFMLTSDASNANFASTMVAEGPAVKLFQSEQQFFAAEFNRLWRWVMQEAVNKDQLPADFLDQVRPEWTFPQLINRDRPRERMADVHLIQTGVLSRAEVARRDGADPQQMRNELDDEHVESATT